MHIRGEYLHEFEVMRSPSRTRARRSLDGARHRPAPRRRRIHLRRGDSAARVAWEGRRGQPRPRPPFPPVTGLYGAPTQINNVSTIALVLKVLEARLGRVLEDRAPSAPGTAVFLSGNVAQPELRAPARRDAPRADLRRGRGRRERARAEGRHPGRVVRPCARHRTRSTRRWTTTRSGRRPSLRLGGDHRRRRPLLHGAARPARGAVLHARVVRQVHAVLAGTRWLVQLLTKIEEGEAAKTDPCASSRCATGCRTSLGKLGDFAVVLRCRATCGKYRAEFEAHVHEGGCPFAGESSIEGLALIAQHARPEPEVARARARLPHRRRLRPGPGGHRGSSRPRRRGRRDPGLLLRATPRMPRRRVPHVPRRDRGHGEAAGGLHADGRKAWSSAPPRPP